MIKRKIIISYYSKENDKLIQSKPTTCTLDQINELLLKFYPKEKHIQTDRNGNKYLSGSYDITSKINEELFKTFGILADIENFNCQIEYE